MNERTFLRAVVLVLCWQCGRAILENQRGEQPDYEARGRPEVTPKGAPRGEEDQQAVLEDHHEEQPVLNPE